MVSSARAQHLRRLAAIVEDPSTYHWVPPLLDAVKDKDPVDVANALEMLARVFSQ
jgi:hypothetical protein